MKLCIVGAGGRMGNWVTASAHLDPDVEIVGGVDHDKSEFIGRTLADNVKVTTDLAEAMTGADVYIDFSAPDATRAAAEFAAANGIAAVIGTTGLDDAAERALADLAEKAPMLIAANFSLGVNLMLALAEKAAAALPQYDLEVVELHHNRKRDSPSGTAIALAKALAEGRGIDYDEAKVYAREGDVGPRTANEIGVVAIRGGDIVGEHTAYLVGQNERIELTHRASRRTLFADGAVHAAKWLVGKSPGRYSMRDVLGV